MLTAKPVIYLVNMSEADYIKKGNKWLPKIKKWIDENGGGPIVPFCGAMEKKVSFPNKFYCVVTLCFFFVSYWTWRMMLVQNIYKIIRHQVPFQRLLKLAMNICNLFTFSLVVVMKSNVGPFEY